MRKSQLAVLAVSLGIFASAFTYSAIRASGANATSGSEKAQPPRTVPSAVKSKESAAATPKIPRFAISQGHRAFRIPVQTFEGSTAMVAAGDFVDVLSVSPGRDGAVLSHTVAQNVLVLRNEAAHTPPKDVTGFWLEVEPREARNLLAAGQRGKLFVSLRAPGDDQEETMVVSTPAPKDREVAQPPVAAAPSPVLPRPPAASVRPLTVKAAPTELVTIIRGGDRELLEVPR